MQGCHVLAEFAGSRSLLRKLFPRVLRFFALLKKTVFELISFNWITIINNNLIIYIAPDQLSHPHNNETKIIYKLINL